MVSIRNLGAVSVLCLVPPFVQADEMQRLEDGSERLTGNFYAFFQSRLPELGPAPEWDDTDRQIGQCFLDKLTASGGGAVVEDFLRGLEILAEIEITTFETYASVASTPIYLADAVLAAAECGVAERAMQNDMESGLMALLSDPENVARLQAD